MAQNYINKTQIKVGNNTSTYIVEPTLYSAASTSDSGGAYTATLDNFGLTTGATVQIKFAATNKASATLNVNSTGAKTIFYNNAAIVANTLKANHTYTLVYDGTQWQLVGDIDTNTTYANGTGITIGSGNAINHSNSVTAQTTQGFYPIKIDAQGHINGYGTAIIPVTSVNGHTGSSVSVTASDLGLASALKYVGAKSSLPTATDSTTYSTYNNGDVITVSNKEYAYVKGSNAAGSSWVELGDEGSYKLKQTAITKPTAVTNKWASAIGQDAHGVLTVDYASLDTSGTWSGNASTATKLAASKTIWGQSFDGSANISGKLTGVGDEIRSGTDVTNINFLTSSGGALNAKFGYLGLAGTYANIDNTNFRLDVHGPIRSYNTTTNGRVPMNAGLTGLPSYRTAQKYGTIIYSNGISMRDPYTGNGNDCAFIRHIETTTNNGYLEIGVGDDGTEPVYIRQYNTSSAVVAEITLLNASHNSEFRTIIPKTNNTYNLGAADNKWANIYASTFTGNLTGNAATATEFSSNATVTLTGDTTGTSGGSKKSWSVPTTTSYFTKLGNLDADKNENDYHGTPSKIKFYTHVNTSRPINCPEPSYNSGLIVLSTGRSTDDTFQIEYSINTGDIYTRSWLAGPSEYPGWKTILNSTNYTTYTVKKDGTGASGSWGISVTGSSGSCTGLAAKATRDGDGNTISSTYLKLSGGTMTGALTISKRYFGTSPTRADGAIVFTTVSHDETTSGTYYRPWLSGCEGVNNKGYGNSWSQGLYVEGANNTSTGNIGYYFGTNWDGNATTSYVWKYTRDGRSHFPGGIGVQNSNATTGIGLSLYGGATSGAPTYGIMFAGTGTFGTHGAVTSDWATYFTMSDTTNRGWIFRRGSTNVASIDGTGKLYLGYAANTNNPGVYWNPYVESASDGSDVTAIYQIKSGVAGGTELRITQANDSGDVINICSPYYIYMNSKRIFTINDNWFRINENSGFSSGVYFGSGTGGVVRTDNQFQVGDSGSKFYANSGGNGYFSNSLGIAGTNANYKLHVNGATNSTTYTINTKVRLEWNAADLSLDFIFV